MVRIGGVASSICGTSGWTDRVHNSICGTHPTSVLVSHGTNRHRMDRSVQVSVLQFGWTFRTPMVHVGMSLQLHRESQCPSEHLITVLKYWESHCPSGHLKAILDIYDLQYWGGGVSSPYQNVGGLKPPCPQVLCL